MARGPCVASDILVFGVDFVGVSDVENYASLCILHKRYYADCVQLCDPCFFFYRVSNWCTTSRLSYVDYWHTISDQFRFSDIEIATSTSLFRDLKTMLGRFLGSAVCLRFVTPSPSIQQPLFVS